MYDFHNKSIGVTWIFNSLGVVRQQHQKLKTVRATSHLCVKREWPLIITYSLYSENIMHYHLYLKHVRGKKWRWSRWKIGIISIIKAISTCASRGKRMRFLDVYVLFWKFQEVSQSCNLLRLIHMYPATESGRSKRNLFVIDDYLSWLFSSEEHQWMIIPHRNASVP